MEIIARILSTASVTAAQAQLRVINRMIEAKNPQHEMIERNENLARDLQNALLHLYDNEQEIRSLRNDLLSRDKMLFEQAAEIKRLTNENKELKELL